MTKLREVRDHQGNLVGTIEQKSDGLFEARDRHGNLKGVYDSTRNQTRDRNGHMMGHGNLLTNLLFSP